MASTLVDAITPSSVVYDIDHTEDRLMKVPSSAVVDALDAAEDTADVVAAVDDWVGEQ